jgi:hypothetical protein
VQPVPLHAPSPVSPIGFKTLMAATLVLVALVAIMMLPSRAPASNRQERHDIRAAAQFEVEQAWARFDPGSMSSVSLRPYEKAFAEVERLNVGTFVEILAIETKFQLPTHTLSKFLEWKKKLPSALPADPTKTKAQLMAAKRAREVQESVAASKKKAEDDASLKATAAAAIAKRYKDSLDDMMLEAVKQTLSEAAGHDITLEAACKRVCVARRRIQFFSVFTPYRFLTLSTNMATDTITQYNIVL